MIAFAVSLPAISLPQRIDPQEVLQYFSWWAYALVAAAYSAFVFSGELSKEGPVIFSKQNARSVSQVLVTHGAFLVILLCFLRLTSYFVLALPHWMNDTFDAGRRGRLSIADIVVFVASGIMVLIERRRLYVQSGNDSAGSMDPPP